MVQTSGFQLVDAGSIAASGTASVVVAVPNGTNKLLIKVAAKYAAVAGTSGLTAALQYSPDGSAYTNSGAPSPTVKPAATVLGTYTFEVGVADFATRRDPGPLLDYKVNFTNTDATNAVTYVVEYAAL